MLTSESTTESEDVDGKFMVKIVSSFASGLNLEASTREERDAWKSAIDGVITTCSGLLRGYIIKQASLLSGGYKRYFFVLHKTGITCHSAYDKTATIIDTMRLDNETELVGKDDERVLQLIDKTTKNKTWSLQFDISGDEYMLWKAHVATIVQSKLDEKQKNHRGSVFIMQSKSAAVYSGKLWLVGADETPAAMCSAVLTEATEFYGPMLVLMEDDPRVDGAQIHKIDVPINSGCSVVDAASDGFMIVTPEKIVRLKATSKQEKAQWTFVIREVIYDLEPDMSDPLLAAAQKYIENPELISYTFEVKASLGIALERVGEWPVLQSVSNANLLGVRVVPGDILHAANGRELILDSYEAMRSKLVAWKPPLTLTFRHMPDKTGYFTKRSLTDTSKWRERYFVLGCGRLTYRRSADDDRTKGDISLFGSSISLVSPDNADGKLFCVRVLAGDKGILLQMRNEEEQLDWAGALHYTAFILNGSSQIAYAKRKDAEEARRILLEAEQEAERIAREAEEARIKEEEEAAAAEMARIEAEAVAAAERQAREEAMAAAEAEMAEMARIEEEARLAAEAEEAEVARAQEAARLAAEADTATPPKPPTIEDEEDYLDGLSIFELQEEATATRDDLVTMFGQYSKMIDVQSGAARAPGVAETSRASVRSMERRAVGRDPRLMNPAGFVALYRLASKGASRDLFSEMKLFNRFDLKDRGHLDESDFVDGWQVLEKSEDPKVLRQLRELKKLVEKRQITHL